jgi:hypothetical protein
LLSIVTEGVAVKVPTVKPITERDFTDQVIQLASRLGWLCLHIRPGRTVAGWRTCVQGQGKGFPDVLAVHKVSGRIFVAELKSNHGRLSPEQEIWLQLFRAAGIPAYVWTPKNWGAIEDVLRGQHPEDVQGDAGGTRHGTGGAGAARATPKGRDARLRTQGGTS